MRKFAAFDIDGTLFRWQLYHELVFELKQLGHFNESETSELDSALMSWQAKRISWRDYEMKVMETIEANITHITPDILESASKTVVERSGHKIYGYTAKLLKNLKKQGYYTIAISASQQEIAEQFAARYEFDDCIAAVYEREGDSYTGQKSRIVHGRKDEIIKEYLHTHPDLSLDGSIAVGDSGGDITMLALVEQPIAFNPSEELLDSAIEHGWKIIIERKNIAYSLQKGNDGTFILAHTDRF